MSRQQEIVTTFGTHIYNALPPGLSYAPVTESYDFGLLQPHEARPGHIPHYDTAEIRAVAREAVTVPELNSVAALAVFKTADVDNMLFRYYRLHQLHPNSIPFEDTRPLTDEEAELAVPLAARPQDPSELIRLLVKDIVSDVRMRMQISDPIPRGIWFSTP